jgi:ribosomal protein S6--L-glutamate ligase
MLEINYFFGRRGLGGSEPFYRIFTEEVDKWLKGLDLQN